MSADNTGQSENVETDHSYDGIKEFDNPMPRWWLLTFYGAIVFSIFYWGFYETSGAGLTQMEDFDEIMVKAKEEADKKAGTVSNEELLLLAKDPAKVAAGLEVYTTNCVACHAGGGVGLVGPNLTDDYWVHGADPMAIHTIVSDGFLPKGMPGWRMVLGPTKVKEATAYVLSLKGTNQAGKAAEGKNAKGESAP